MIRDKRWFAIVYMFAVTAVFSSIVIAFAQYTKDQVEANKRLAFERAVLSVLPVEVTADQTIHDSFVSKVGEPTDQTAGAYILREDGSIAAYALPFAGQGFWAPVKGVIGIAADKTTVISVAFYEQNETPGLGAEITKPAFIEQFAGRELSLTGKPLSFRRAGYELGSSDVYAVTGATQTSARVEKMINQAVKEWLTAVGRREGN